MREQVGSVEIQIGASILGCCLATCRTKILHADLIKHLNGAEVATSDPQWAFNM